MLTVRLKFLSDNNKTTYGAACVFCCINLEDNYMYTFFYGIVETNLSRDKVEIVIHFTIPDESPAGAECNWHQSTSITRIRRSNCHINSYSGIYVFQLISFASFNKSDK